jgi:hypothetical protein
VQDSQPKQSTPASPKAALKRDASDRPEGVREGFPVATVAGLNEAVQAGEHYELLRGLTSGGEEDFTLRFAAVADLVHADQTLWPLDALERRFIWMEPDRIMGVIRALRRSGWLETVGHGYRLTSDGLAVYATISRLASLRNGRDDDLAMGVFDLEASARLNEDTGPALRHLAHHLRRSIEDVEAAVASQSELKVMDARDKLDKNLQWSARARQLLDGLNVEKDAGYRAGQRLGRDLSELHRWHSVMQRVLDEIGRTRLPLGALGIRPADIDRYLSGLSVDQLVQLGQGSLSRPVWPLLAVTDNLINVAEWELLYAEHPEQRRVGWREGVADVAEVGEPPPSEGEIAFSRFESTLDEIVVVGESVRLERALLAGTFPKSCYWMTLLALEDEMPDGRVRVEVGVGEARTLFSDFASEISDGLIVPRKPNKETDA